MSDLAVRAGCVCRQGGAAATRAQRPSHCCSLPAQAELSPHPLLTLCWSSSAGSGTRPWEPLCSQHCRCGLFNKSQMGKQRGTEPTQLQAFQLCSRCRVPECGILLRNILSSVCARCVGSPACAQPLTQLPGIPAQLPARLGCSEPSHRMGSRTRSLRVEREQRKSRAQGALRGLSCCSAASLLECPLPSQPLACT